MFLLLNFKGYGPITEEIPDGVKHEINDANTIESPTRMVSMWMTGCSVFNLINAMGIMGIPYAFANAGWVALPLILISGCAACFTSNLIRECLYDQVPSGSVNLK